jgi:DNA-directed RNA polymerase specialized sigma24 family protein
VAEVVGISEANGKTRLHRARVLLREHLESS